MSEMVWMEHESLGPERRQQVTKRSFETAWSKAGWELSDAPPEPESELESKTVKELQKMASDAEIEGRSGMDKEELIAALEEADNGEPTPPVTPELSTSSSEDSVDLMSSGYPENEPENEE